MYFKVVKILLNFVIYKGIEKLVDYKYQFHPGVTYEFILNSRELHKFFFIIYSLFATTNCFFRDKDTLIQPNPLIRLINTICGGRHPTPEQPIKLLSAVKINHNVKNAKAQ